MIYDAVERMWSRCHRCGARIGDLGRLYESVHVQDREGNNLGIAHIDCAQDATWYVDKPYPTRTWVVFDDEDTYEPPLLDFARADSEAE